MRYTRSVCPVCLRPVEAHILKRNGVSYLEKTCHEHGTFSVPIWHGKLSMDEWRKGCAPLAEGEGLHCPENCGICAEHSSGTCCALLEVTNRCDLFCRYCFADSGGGSADPSLFTLKSAISDIMRLGGNPLLQLSGGEPTLRDDLPEIIAFARSIGCSYVQLNTNGLRLGTDAAYARALADAGLSFVFLQFDGTTDDVYTTLRGKPLLEVKLAAIRNCGAAGLGVTLVPTIVRGVNDRQLRNIVRLGVSLSPTVRGVHFQPVSYFGRYPHTESERYTLDEMIVDLCDQLSLPLRALKPSRCDHPMCGFHGSFVVLPDKTLMSLSRYADQEVCKTSARQNREYIARRWRREAEKPCCCGTKAESQKEGAAEIEPFDSANMDAFLARITEYSFTLTSMAFQDAMNLDIERLRQCSLHVWHDGRLMPFCAAYLTPVKK